MQSRRPSYQFIVKAKFLFPDSRLISFLASEDVYDEFQDYADFTKDLNETSLLQGEPEASCYLWEAHMSFGLEFFRLCVNH